MLELEDYIQSYFGVESSDLSQITSLFNKTDLAKGDYYVEEGRKCKSLSFIISGNLRVYSNEGQKEITQWIASKGEFVTDLSSFIFDTPARWNVQAITNCELYTINEEEYSKIVDLVPDWDKLEKRFIASCFLTLEDRVFSFLSMDAQQRYQNLFAFKKEIFNQVPLTYIASMLGMSPETLSRIRAQNNS